MPPAEVPSLKHWRCVAACLLPECLHPPACLPVALLQDEPAYCGLASLAMTLNTLSIDPRRTWKGPWRW